MPTTHMARCRKAFLAFGLVRRDPLANDNAERMITPPPPHLSTLTSAPPVELVRGKVGCLERDKLV